MTTNRINIKVREICDSTSRGCEKAFKKARKAKDRRARKNFTLD